MAEQAPSRRDKVSLAGHVGSGKSTAARLLAERTGWRLVSAGGLFREIAEARDLSVLELNRRAETDPTIDDAVDGHLRDLARSPEPLVIDSRMAWHFVPQSLKVFLVVDPLVGAERVHGAGRRDERYESLEAAADASRARQDAEADRYRMLYGVERDDWRNYELVIDTTHSTPERTVDLVLDALDALSGPPEETPTCWLSPRRLVPADRREETPDGDVAVSVVAGTIVLIRGHDTVAAALEQDRHFVRSRLLTFHPGDPGPAAIPAGPGSTVSVSPENLGTWEKRHGIRLPAPPEWSGRA